jgi:hypothetical protein
VNGHVRAESFSSPSRRALLQALTAAGIVGLPSSGHAAVLDDPARRVLAAVAEAFVPGAVRAGVVDFVTAMLASPKPMQFYGYLNFSQPPRDFYPAALTSLAVFAKARTGKAVDALPSENLQEVLAGLLAPDVPGWNGPPPILVYLSLRNDAVDVVYGGETAYDDLGLPYMAHIAPPRPW